MPDSPHKGCRPASKGAGFGLGPAGVEPVGTRVNLLTMINNTGVPRVELAAVDVLSTSGTGFQRRAGFCSP
jgi:hypothetical protein